MATASFEIVTYWYYDWSSRQTAKTHLILKGAAGQTCSVYLVDNETVVLPLAVQIAPNFYNFYYHHRHLQHLIDMLRYEKPIYVFFNNDNGFSNSRISTSDEPVGVGAES